MTAKSSSTPIPSALAYPLSSVLHRTVIDKTGLTAHFDLHLIWAPERHTAVQDDGHDPTDTGPSIFSAIQDQLGLKLVSDKGHVPTLVIDHIDFPTPNQSGLKAIRSGHYARAR